MDLGIGSTRPLIDGKIDIHRSEVSREHYSGIRAIDPASLWTMNESLLPEKKGTPFS